MLNGTIRLAAKSLLGSAYLSYCLRMETQTQSILPVISEIGATSVALESQTYSVAEAAQVLGVSMVTVYRLILRRVFRPLPLLRHKRIPKRQIQAFLNS